MDYIDPAGPYPIGVNLYGVRYDASPTVVLGDYGHDGSGSGTLLQEDVFVATNYAVYGYNILNTDELGGGQLALWLTAQYDAGAVPGDYVFLRFEGKQTTENPFKIASGDTTLQTPPELTIVLGPDGYVAPPPPPPPPLPTGFTLVGSTTDTFIGLDAAGTAVPYWVGQQELNVGHDNAANSQSNNCAVLVFELPDLEGIAISNANLDISMKVSFPGAANWPASIDLYGVRYDSSATVLASDYAPVGNNVGNGTLLQDNVASLTDNNDLTYAAYTHIDSSAIGSAALVSWITAQYDAGAVAGDYVFLRFNTDELSTGPWQIASANNTDTNLLPVLTLELDVPVADSEFVSVEQVSAGVLKLVFSASEPLSARKLVGSDDLTSGIWNYMPHSDNSGGPFALGDLSISTPEGANHAIYVETTGAATFYGIE